MVYQANVNQRVASHFIENIDSLPEINHKDEIKSNNHIDNLEWCTPKYNVNYGTSKKRIQAHPNYKAMIENKRKKIVQYTFLGNFINSFNSVSAAIKESGCSRNSIQENLNGTCNGLGLYIWEYAK